MFPFTPQTKLLHAMGGRIVTVHGIKHQCIKPQDGRSMDAWWYDCDVMWEDTGKTSRSPVDPNQLCSEGEGSNPEILKLSRAMSDYLNKHGTWSNSGWRAHGGK